MDRSTRRALARGLEMFEQISAATSRAGAVREMLAGLYDLIPCDLAASNRVCVDVGAMQPAFLPHSPWRDAAHQLAPHVGTHPLIQHFARAPDDHEARRTTDVCSPRQWFASPVYCDVFASTGLRYQLGFGMQVRPGVLDGFTLSRTSSDFSENERDGLSVVAHRVMQLITRFDLVESSRQVNGGLTPREQQVLDGIAAGRSAEVIALHLGISARTVDKHLERIYRKLGVRTGLAAVAAACVTKA